MNFPHEGIIQITDDINNKEVDVEIVKIGSPVCSALDFNQYRGD